MTLLRLAPLAVLATLAAAALLVPAADPHAVDLARRFAPPSLDHPLGADHLGRDLFARLAEGGARTLVALAFVQAACVLVGAPAGLVAALTDGTPARALRRLVHLFAAVPRLVVALVVSGLVGFAPLAAALAVAATGWARHALVVEGLAARVVGEEHWRAALALGATRPGAALRHLAPAIARPYGAFVGADAARVVLIFASLAFLGLGADTGRPDWGAMVWEYRLHLFEAPRLVLAPLAAIAATALAFHLALDGPGLRSGAGSRPDPRRGSASGPAARNVR